MAEIDLESIRVVLAQAPNPSAGAPSSIQATTLSTLEKAQASAPFPVRVPSYTPGFRFHEGVLIGSPRQVVILKYVGEDGRFGFSLLEAPAGQYESAPGGPRRYIVVGDSLSESQVASKRAAVAEILPPPGKEGLNTSLVWESDGLLLHIISQGISLSNLGDIAASV